MKNVEKLEELLAPYYDQFEKLGDLWEDEMLSWGFLKRARKRFGKQYFGELRLFFGAENRLLRHKVRMAKHKDKALFKRAWRNMCAKERMQHKAERKQIATARKKEHKKRKRLRKIQRGRQAFCADKAEKAALTASSDKTE